MTQSGKIFHIHGLEELILLKRQYYQKTSSDSMQSLSRVQWYFLQMLKDTSKIYMEPQKTLNGQRNSEEEEQKQEASHSLIGIKNQQTKTELSPEKIPKYIQSTNILTKVPRKDSGFNKPC